MEKKTIITWINKIFWSIIFWVLAIIIYLWLLIIYQFHKLVPFFPILFLFDFCFWLGNPLFVKYVLKKRWYEYTKGDYLKVKRILIPWLIMEIMITIYYYPKLELAINAFIEMTS